MAFPTSVNDQITDAVTQTNVKVLGDAPAVGMGMLYQVTRGAANQLSAPRLGASPPAGKSEGTASPGSSRGHAQTGRAR
jgi:Killing trait